MSNIATSVGGSQNPLQPSQRPAYLILADGTVFHGVSIGAAGSQVGEVVFNTSMTGYQEILTDPSYAQQFVTLTYPHIGNTGVNVEDEESSAISASGLIIRDLPLLHSNFRSEQSLSDYLRSREVVAIAELDTRHLTQVIREKGAQNACLVAGDSDEELLSQDQALKMARDFPGLQGKDLAKVVSTAKAYFWEGGTWSLKASFAHVDSADEDERSSLSEQKLEKENDNYKIVAYDFGVKSNILRMLVDRGCDITVVPAQTPAEDVLAMNPDGIFLSNGPGDPEPCDYAIEAIQAFLEASIPLFGICLGFQLLAMSVGAKTVKMKFGHHGGNHPVQDLASNQVFITSQNHGFAVDETTLPEGVVATHRSLFDGSLQGIRLVDKPALGFQGHPEASPGPHDMGGLFDDFIDLLKKT